ncbi:translocation/assembly module TamB domain-containing protein [Halovulum sp. GXIMD14794]
MRRYLLPLLLLLTLNAGVATAQDTAEGEDDNGFVINLLERQLSTDSRKIRLSGVNGLLSSEAEVGLITISDQDGVWLRIEDARLDWSRTALLRGRVQVNSIAAERIIVRRKPLPEPDKLPDPSAGPAFQIPELPVSVRIDELTVASVELSEDVAGTAAQLRVDGSLVLADGTLESSLTIDRLDGPGGRFSLDATVDGDGVVDVNLAASEPRNGVVVNLLNIEGRPALEAAVYATGTLEDLRVELDFKADGQDLFDGEVEVVQQDGLYSFDASLAGRFQSLLPPEFHQLVAGEATLTASGEQTAGGGFHLDDFALDSGGLRLTGNVRTTADGFPEHLEIDGALNPESGDPLVLPGESGVTVAGGTIRLRYGNGSEWSGEIAVTGVETPNVSIDATTLTMGGLAMRLDEPDRRQVTAVIDGTVEGISGDDPALAQALEGALNLHVDAAWNAGEPVVLKDTTVQVGTVELVLNGEASEAGFNGRLRIDAEDMAHFAALADRDLGGSLNAVVEGQVDPLNGSFDLLLDGQAVDLALGVPQLDPLLQGETVLAGGLGRSEEGIRARDFRIENPELSLRADGIYAALGSDFSFTAALSDLGLVTEQASGAVRFEANATGGVDGLQMTAELAMPEGTLEGRPVSDAVLDLVVSGANAQQVSGSINGGAQVGDLPVRMDGGFSLNNGVQAVKAFTFTAGATQLDITAARGTDGLVAGTVDLESPDISEVAALALLDAQGAADATLIFSRSKGTQRVSMTGGVSGIEVEGVSVGNADLDLVISDVLGVPLASGTAEVRDVEAAGFTLNALSLAAEADGDRMNLTADAAMQDGTRASLAGSLANLRPGIELELEALDLTRDDIAARLIDPATATLRDGTVTVTPLALAIGDGRLEVVGSAGEVLDLQLALTSLPLDVANAVVPDLAVEGRVSGQATVTGTPDNPTADFSVDARGMSAAPLVEFGVPPVSLSGSGRVENRVVTADATAQAGDKLDLALAGSVPMDPEAEGLDLEIVLRSLALDLANAAAPDLQLSGTVSGRAEVSGSIAAPKPSFDIGAEDVTAAPLVAAGLPPARIALQGTEDNGLVALSGTAQAGDLVQLTVDGSVPVDPAAETMDLTMTIQRLSLALAEAAAPGTGATGSVTGTVVANGAPLDPSVQFNLTGSGISATALRENGLPALSLDVAGSYAGMVVQLDRAAVTGGGVQANASGAIPLQGDGLSVDVTAQAPLSVANIALASSGAQLQGTLNANVTASGSLQAPSLSGSANIGNGTFALRSANLRIDGITAAARFDGDRVLLENLSGTFAGGGTVRAGGSIGITAPYPADLSMDISQARYTDGRIVNTVINGDLALQGPILGDGLLSGRIDLGRTEIAIPRSFGIAEGVLLDIDHRDPPRDVVLTLERAGVLGQSVEEEDSGGLPLRVDLLVSVPNQLFIRGRGLDAEMGGEIRLRGTLADIQPVGEIELIRGRLSILGQRIDFDEGSVTLIGSLDPQLRFVAVTEASDGTTVNVTVQGPATDPEVTFSSSPDLPQDEVLALLIFNRNLSDLSPVQIAQLAGAAATLSGRGGNSLVDRFRSGTGLANLDFTTGDDGEVGVRAGAYLNDRTYLDVEANAEGESIATINLDISDSVRAKASVDNEGETSIGIFFERDY